MLKLSIKLNSIHLSNDIVKPGDTIRISITTLPDEQKKIQTVQAKDLDIATPSFLIDVKKDFKKMIFVFRKKSFFSNGPIIASAVIKREEINIFDSDSDNDYKKITIYEPVSKQHNPKNRQIVGSMESSFILKEQLQRVRCIVKDDNGKEFSSLNSYFNENENPNFVF